MQCTDSYIEGSLKHPPNRRRSYGTLNLNQTEPLKHKPLALSLKPKLVGRSLVKSCGPKALVSRSFMVTV